MAFLGPQGSRLPFRSPPEVPTTLQPHCATRRQLVPHYACRFRGRDASFFGASRVGDPASGADHRAQQLGGNHAWSAPPDLSQGFSSPSSDGTSPRPRPTQYRQQRSHVVGKPDAAAPAR